MALTTYAELQTAVAGFLNRDDLTAIVPTFISLAEAQMQRDIRHWRMQVREAITFAGRYTAIPDNWVETIRLTIPTEGASPLRLASVADMAERRANDYDTVGTPCYYTFNAGEIELWPSPDTSLIGEIIYYRTIPTLSDINTTNWLLALAPDAYLYGALTQSAPYLSEDARIAVWGALFTSAVGRLNETSDAAKWSGTGLKMRLRNG